MIATGFNQSKEGERVGGKVSGLNLQIDHPDAGVDKLSAGGDGVMSDSSSQECM